MILVIHAIIMIIIAKIFKLNLAMCSIAVVMALLGFLVGTRGGLIVAKILLGFAV
ncbi:hypothetical protein fh0823_09430 [Francisella halioticida]|nr:hypothetical protein fh0823_09430 [Francisella halioticida]